MWCMCGLQDDQFGRVVFTGELGELGEKETRSGSMFVFSVENSCLDYPGFSRLCVVVGNE